MPAASPTTERECLRLREAGYTFQEIAAVLSLPQTTTYVMFRQLKARILAIWQTNDPTHLSGP